MCGGLCVPASVLILIDVVVEQLGDEVDVRQDHTSAAVARQTKAIESHALDGFLALSLARSSLIGLSASRVDTSLLVRLNGRDQINVLSVLVSDNLNEDNSVSPTSYWLVSAYTYLAAGEAANRNDHCECKC